MKSVAIIGSGPAALMVADVLSSAGQKVAVFEKKKGPGRKLLIAGSSGLNITNSQPATEFLKNYTGATNLWKSLLQDFSPQDWIQFIEGLGLSTFEGTSGRYFVKEMKASKLLRAWIGRLTERGVKFHYGYENKGFVSSSDSEGTGALKLIPLFQTETEHSLEFDALCFCIGGGSYEPNEVPLRWPSAFISKGIGFDPFVPSNVGYQVKWPAAFLKECEGQPFKNIRLSSTKGSRLGDLVVTEYGLEGTPVYFVGQPGEVKMDLKPDLSAEQILVKCRAVKENLSPMRRIKKQLALCPASLALLFHCTPKEVASDLNRLIAILKNFPIQFLKSQSLDEAISSAGGVQITELNDDLMLVRHPGVFAAGEMLNWDAPTGGFLIQGCVSQGYRAGQGILKFITRGVKPTGE
jgi:uncharacterized flavoprotein (TIGR03862 family)